MGVTYIEDRARNISGCFLMLPQGEEYSPVILGEEGDDQAPLGVVTLVELGLCAEPIQPHPPADAANTVTGSQWRG